MSPVSIPAQQQKTLHSEQQTLLLASHQLAQQSHAMELTAANVPSGFPLNYQQLYANNAALYGAPVMFSGAIHAAHASYMAGLPIHAALSPNDTYLKAIQAAACGIYNPTALAPPPISAPNHIPCKPTSIHNATGPMMALASSTVTGIPPKSPQYMSNELVNKSEADQAKDYQVQTSINTHQKAQRLNNSGSGSGTYLNDKVNDTNCDAVNDSHFKVPNGKEGSLKHRILRPSGNECPETNKTPVMRYVNSLYPHYV